MLHIPLFFQLLRPKYRTAFGCGANSSRILGSKNNLALTTGPGALFTVPAVLTDPVPPSLISVPTSVIRSVTLPISTTTTSSITSAPVTTTSPVTSALVTTTSPVASAPVITTSPTMPAISPQISTTSLIPNTSSATSGSSTATPEPEPNHSTSLTGGTIAGISVGTIVAIVSIIATIWQKCFRGRRSEGNTHTTLQVWNYFNHHHGRESRPPHQPVELHDLPLHYPVQTQPTEYHDNPEMVYQRPKAP